ncbi:hypothetical protein HMPREF9444_02183 [Succinatimonas hippei YIT 12066]|uniref:Uncharacterized protein n=1 Tax=Succinatimonas hippei (strain DSM 22608 / JCM 16073 / KCTC 15190 / YIT 12066) TaxID=762983 RepID=E8LN29_SUCHY|nr:hypothetical protein HMPREF9444_02183 [Succinatimonas hippei YIT 12066]
MSDYRIHSFTSLTVKRKENKFIKEKQLSGDTFFNTLSTYALWQ